MKEQSKNIVENEEIEDSYDDDDDDDYDDDDEAYIEWVILLIKVNTI